MFSLVIQHHAHRPCANLRCKLVRRFAHIGSTYSEVGASGKPGAVQTACKIALVPHAALDQLVATRPSLTKLLWFSTLLDAAMHREWIFRLGRLDAIARVSHFFCETEAKLRAIGRSDGARFALPMTQADLGEACGITSVHMNRMLRELKDRDLLAIHRHDVEIRDLRGLARLGEFDPAYLFLDEQD